MPLDNNVDKTEIGEKVGRATAKSMWWLVTWGDAGAAAAADDGDIEVIRHLDMNLKVIFFGFYMKRTTIAYGD